MVPIKETTPMSTPATLHFFFDFISGYAYLAWRQLPEFCKKYDLSLELHPVVFGALLDHWGQLGPAEIPAKKAFVYRDGYRQAAIQGFTFNPPKFHPFNPLPALRASLRDVSGTDQHQVIDAIFRAGWTQGRDIGDPEELCRILEASQLPGKSILSRTQDPAVKGRLKAETHEAIEQGVFGVPTMIFQGRLFWGSDQFPYLKLLVEGKDPLDESAVQEMLKRPRAVDRKKFTNK